MKKYLVWLLLMFTLALSAQVIAAPKTVTLSVPGMHCAVCPITVKKALDKVPGVTRTEVSLEMRKATVTFDDTRANVDNLTQATADAGYPSIVIGTVK